MYDAKSLPVRLPVEVVTEYEHGALGREHVQPPGSTWRTVYVPGLSPEIAYAPDASVVADGSPVSLAPLALEST